MTTSDGSCGYGHSKHCTFDDATLTLSAQENAVNAHPPFQAGPILRLDGSSDLLVLWCAWLMPVVASMALPPSGYPKTHLAAKGPQREVNVIIPGWTHYRQKET